MARETEHYEYIGVKACLVTTTVRESHGRSPRRQLGVKSGYVGPIPARARPNSPKLCVSITKYDQRMAMNLVFQNQGVSILAENDHEVNPSWVGSSKLAQALPNSLLRMGKVQQA